MTWPWAAHLRDASADAVDSYIGAWILSWDFTQTFHDLTSEGPAGGLAAAAIGLPSCDPEKLGS